MKLEIELGNGYFLTNNSRNYILARKTKQSKTFTPIGYFQTVSGAIKSYYEWLKKDSGNVKITSFDDYIEQIKELDNQVLTRVDELKDILPKLS